MTQQTPAPAARKGRGATYNPDNRFFQTRSEAASDGWSLAPDPLPPLDTSVTPIQARRIISTNTSPDIPFTHSLNPYQGCEHEIRSSQELRMLAEQRPAPKRQR